MNARSRLPTSASSPIPSELVAIVRPHITIVAMAATITFGWLMTGRYPWAVAAVVGFDWFFVNFVNRIADVAEDTKNGVAGTDFLTRYRAVLLGGSLMTVLASLAVTHAFYPALSPARFTVFVIGLGYSYPIVPTVRGFRRLKELYFFKNFGSAVLFVVTGFLYPLAIVPTVMPALGIVLLVLFFVPFEMTFEILYDMRDLEGDRSEGVPTFPVVHGLAGARRLFDALLALSAVPLVFGLATGRLGVREGLMLVAPVVQRVFYRSRPHKIDARSCVVATHIATVELAIFSMATFAWRAAGLPANIFLR